MKNGCLGMLVAKEHDGYLKMVQSINQVFVYWRKHPFWHRRGRGVQYN